MVFECIFCLRNMVNQGGLATHQPYCKENPNRIIRIMARNNNVPHFRKGAIAWNKGLTAGSDDRIKNGAAKRKASIESGAYIPKGIPHTDETRMLLSKLKRDLYDSGWECIAGRCKKYNYESPIAGKIKVDGTWELITCRYFDLLGIQWRRNKKRFPYIRPDGKKATYQPDFYVSNWDIYIEVKGYETELDQAKWKYFPHKLDIYRKQEINNIEMRLKESELERI